MKLTAMVKLQPTPAQADALRRTLEAANAACDEISQVAWAERTFSQYTLHHRVYYAMRERFGLAAQVVIRCIKKVVDAYKLDKATRRTFRADGAIAYDDRVLRYDPEAGVVSIWTVAGRLTIPYHCGAHHAALLLGQRGESDLVYRGGAFYLYPTCDVEQAPLQEVDSYLGVDLGIKNVAADSDGRRYSGAHVNSLRRRHFKLRQRLQAKGTKAARRLLNRRRRKEQRFAKDVNHRISKRLVEKAKGTARGIALEDLTGIRERVTVRKGQRRQHAAWSFADLRTKIAYKACRVGVPVVAVDPRNTSRTCPLCACVDQRNRQSQAAFLCIACGFSGHADTVAARNISARAGAASGAEVNQPHVSDASQPVAEQRQGQAHDF